MAQKNACLIDLRDSSSYSIPVKVAGLDSYRIIKAQLAASPGVMITCRFRVNDTAVVVPFVREFTLEVIREGKTIDERVFKRPNWNLGEMVNILDSGDICRFKDMRVDVPYGYQLPDKQYNIAVQEFLIVSKNRNYDSATKAFIKYIAELPEVKRLHELYDGHVHICRSSIGISPNSNEPKDIISTDLDLSSCSADINVDTYRLDYKWKFIYSRITKKIIVSDEVKHKKYSLKKWKRLSMKIK